MPVGRREVSLADALKKPIIPLLLERMPWPPGGPMSMVFAQLLYVDFSQPSTDVQLDWKCAQFSQLVKQINAHVDRPNTVRTIPRVMVVAENLHDAGGCVYRDGRCDVQSWARAMGIYCSD